MICINIEESANKIFIICLKSKRKTMIMEYFSRRDLGNGWYVEVIERFQNGWGIYRQEKHYDPQDRLVYTKEWREDGTITENWLTK